MVTLDNDWDNILADQLNSPSFIALQQQVSQRRLIEEVYPAPDRVYNALKLTPFHATKVVILGQDPYHGPGQAHGLSFSVPHGVAQPPSLVNIFKEVHNDLKHPTPQHGNLQSWAKQGVLLLNSVLTVTKQQPQSHAKLGWHTFTDGIIQALNQRAQPVVFMLWGAQAQKKAKLITSEKHLILKAPHPSPLSAYRGFFGCRHFSRCNHWLLSQQLHAINWCITL